MRQVGKDIYIYIKEKKEKREKWIWWSKAMNLRGEKEVKRRRWKEEDRFCKFILFIYSFIYYLFVLIWIVVYGALIFVYNYYIMIMEIGLWYLNLDSSSNLIS